MNGVLVIDKPCGPTSHDVVDYVRRTLKLRRVGHTGTLDPFASGVLPLCLGKATRLAAHLAKDEKRYRATVRFGFATTTDDLTGEPLGPARAGSIERERLAAACAPLTGSTLQRPPAFSAKRIGGQRAYRLARRGLSVEQPAVPVTVFSLTLLNCEADRAELAVHCSAGTYVRALARDLGEALGVGAHLIALRRLACGPFTEAEAVSLPCLEKECPARLIPLRALLTAWPSVRVGSEGVTALRHGRELTPALTLQGFPAAAGGPLRVLDPSGELIALATPRGFDEAGARATAERTLHPDTVLLDQ
jgi:tRNA pseudouridine55 synthase